jgi:hypothetical protein
LWHPGLPSRQGLGCEVRTSVQRPMPTSKSPRPRYGVPLSCAGSQHSWTEPSRLQCQAARATPRSSEARRHAGLISSGRARRRRQRDHESRAWCWGRAVVQRRSTPAQRWRACETPRQARGRYWPRRARWPGALRRAMHGGSASARASAGQHAASAQLLQMQSVDGRCRLIFLATPCSPRA